MRTIDPNKKAATRLACAAHLSPWLRVEAEAMGHEVQDEDALGVVVGASLIECLSLVLRLRTASHVLWQLARFRCPTMKALQKELSAFPWERVIPVDGHFTIRSSVTHPSIDNDLYANRLVKDAIADRFTQRIGRRPDSGPQRIGVVIHFYWHEDRATLYLNVNGEPMSDRGYRKMPHEAPMRETLAAGVLMAAGYDGSVPLVNPMCGSGTLAIEAALIAAGRAPGLLRAECAALRTVLPLDDAWRDARAAAKRDASPRAALTLGATPIIASDHDPAAVEAARKNAATAGVDHLIRFARCDFTATPLPEHPPWHIILNPEYGQRLGDSERLAGTYARIGDFFKQHCAGARAHVFTGSRELAKHIGLRPNRRTPFLNATIECRLLSYEMYEGRR